MLLVIDIGGTHTRLAVGLPGSGLADRNSYLSNDFPGIEAVIDQYRADTGISPRTVVMGIPGPVGAPPIRPTNLDWAIDPDRIKTRFSLSGIQVLNDVQALGYAIPALAETDVVLLNRGVTADRCPMALLAPGTGLGEAFLIWHDQGYRAYPSEGGHCDFAPADETETRLLGYLQNKYGRVSYERVCSGPGLGEIYEFLNRDGSVPDHDGRAVMAAKDPARAIFEAACAGASSVARKAVDLFVRVLGAEAGNLALRYGARSGLFLGGGIIPKILPVLDQGLFLAAFRDKGRVSAYLDDIPVKLICHPDANLLGLSCFGKQNLA